MVRDRGSAFSDVDAGERPEQFVEHLDVAAVAGAFYAVMVGYTAVGTKS